MTGPGRNGADGRDHSDSFDFSCAVNLEDGLVRSVDVQSTDVRLTTAGLIHVSLNISSALRDSTELWLTFNAYLDKH
jgi:hypothetical protein